MSGFTRRWTVTAAGGWPPTSMGRRGCWTRPTHHLRPDRPRRRRPHPRPAPDRPPRPGAPAHLLVFRLDPAGFTSPDLRALLGELLGRPPGTITPGQATHDLRRLREHGLIQRIPRTHRYQVTDTGLRHAIFLTRACDRVLHAGLAQLNYPAPPPWAPQAAPAKPPSTTSPSRPESPPDHPNLTRSHRLRRS